MSALSFHSLLPSFRFNSSLPFGRSFRFNSFLSFVSAFRSCQLFPFIRYCLPFVSTLPFRSAVPFVSTLSFHSLVPSFRVSSFLSFVTAFLSFRLFPSVLPFLSLQLFPFIRSFFFSKRCGMEQSRLTCAIQAVTCDHLLPLPATCSTCGRFNRRLRLLAPLAATCGHSSGCKWLQVAASGCVFEIQIARVLHPNVKTHENITSLYF